MAIRASHPEIGRTGKHDDTDNSPQNDKGLLDCAISGRSRRTTG